MNKNSKILITGCGGMLGEAVYKEFKDKYTIYPTDIDLSEPWLRHLDVTSPSEIDKNLRKINPDAIIHLAALTDVEYCEMNPGRAYDVNFIGTLNMARISDKYKIPLVYISTAGIFDGKKQNYSESDTPRPLSIYAKAKYAGELAVLAVPKSIVIRAGWMLGGGPKKDKKFTNKIIKQIRSGAKELFIVNDKMGTPTYTYDLAKTIHYLLNNNLYGVYNEACSGACSRIDMSRQILKTFNLDKKIKIKIVSPKYFNKEYFAPRPASEKLITSKMRSINPRLVRSWNECLIEYLNKFDWKI